MGEKKIIVIGAGPAGLSVSARLCELKYKPLLIESSDKVGGMSGSIEVWGHTVDLGPHRFFSSDKVVVDFWQKYVKSNFVMVSRQTRIYFGNKFFDYPLKPFNALKNLGVFKSLLAVTSYLKAKVLKRKEDGSLEIWISNRFGDLLYKTFFKTYTEKLWGISCRRLDADWAAQRIQKLTLGGAIKNALLKTKKNKHKTLVDEFAYPKTGNQFFYDQLSKYIEESIGEKIKFNSKVVNILTEGNKIKGLSLDNGKNYYCDWLVSTMPITSLIKGLKNVPSNVKLAASKLRFRNTILVYLLINSDQLFTDQWLYIHEPNVFHGRVTNFRNWSPDIVGDDKSTVICLEFWCFDDDPIWLKQDDELIKIASEEISQIGLVDRKLIKAGKLVKIPKCYPVYEKGYKAELEVVTNYLDKIEGLVPIGRYGSFKYNNQDHSLLMGIMAAESIAINKKPNLWDINTDSKYQEAGTTQSLKESN